MLNKICNHISMLLVNKQKIDLKEKDKFRFGLEVLISQGVVFSTIIILSLILNKFYEAILFIWVFGSLRQNSFGYHAATFIGCFLLTLLSFILSITLQITDSFIINSILIISIILFIIVYLSKKEKINKQFIILYFIHIFTFLLVSQMGIIMIYIIPSAIFIVIVSLFFG